LLKNAGDKGKLEKDVDVMMVCWRAPELDAEGTYRNSLRGDSGEIELAGYPSAASASISTGSAGKSAMTGKSASTWPARPVTRGEMGVQYPFSGGNLFCVCRLAALAGVQHLNANNLTFFIEVQNDTRLNFFGFEHPGFSQTQIQRIHFGIIVKSHHFPFCVLSK
jgi:hypothetical protein